MKSAHCVLLSALLLAACGSIVAQTTVAVSISVAFTSPFPSDSPIQTEKAQFAAAFKLGFSSAVAAASCVVTAPVVSQKIAYTPTQGTPTQATITFDYPVDPILNPSLANGVAHVVADPAQWFSTLSASTLYAQRLISFLSSPGGFETSSSVPVLTPTGSGGNCPPPPFRPAVVSPPPPPFPPAILSAPPSPPPPLCVPEVGCYTAIFVSNTTLGRAGHRQLLAAFPTTLGSGLLVGGALYQNLTTEVTGLTLTFDAMNLLYTFQYTLTLCAYNSKALAQVDSDATYYLLQSNTDALAFAALGSFSSATNEPCSSVSPPPPPSPPLTPMSPPLPPLPAVFPSPPPPVACQPDSGITSNILFNGDFAVVSADVGTFQAGLAAALAALWCTCDSGGVTVGVPQPLILSNYTFQVQVNVLYNSTITFATNPSTCGVVSYAGLVDAFSSNDDSIVTCYQRVAAQDPNFSPRWGIIDGVCTEASQQFPPPPPFVFAPPFPPALFPPSPPPVYKSPPAPPRPPPSPPVVRRRMIDSVDEDKVIQIGAVEASDVAYGLDRTMYEVYVQKANYYEAGAVCLSRGTMLASYSEEATQVFVDILCDAAAGMTCWVGSSGQNGMCASVDNSRLKMSSCAERKHFLCMGNAPGKA